MTVTLPLLLFTITVYLVATAATFLYQATYNRTLILTFGVYLPALVAGNILLNPTLAESMKFMPYIIGPAIIFTVISLIVASAVGTKFSNKFYSHLTLLGVGLPSVFFAANFIAQRVQE